MLVFEDEQQEKMFEQAVEEALSNFRDNLTLDNRRAKEHYDDFLDEVNDFVRFGSLVYAPSEVLEAVDPIVYRCGFCDWLDGLEYTDIINLFDVDDILGQLDELGFDVTEDELKKFIEENY